MKKITLKKIASVLLTVVMLASMLSATASAASADTYVKATANVNYTSKVVTVVFRAVQPTTNGKITVEYNADKLTYADCKVTGTATSVDQSAGTVTFGYGTSTPDAIRLQGNIATLTLRINSGASGTTYLKVNVKEFNDFTDSVGDFSVGVQLAETSSGIVIPSQPTQPTNPGTSSGGETEPAKPAVTTSDVAEEGTVVTETTATIESTTKDNTASASVSNAVAEEIVKQAVGNGSDTVVIAPNMGGNVTEAEVSIPATLAADIADKTEAELRIETPVANVTIPNEGLSDLAVDGGNVSVSVGRDGDTVAVTISVNGKQVDEVAGGITVNVPQTGCTPGTVAMLVHEDGTTEVIRMSIASSDGQSITVPLDGSAKVVIVADNSMSLGDVPADSWMANAVAFVTSHELMKGTGDGVFDPGMPMNRSMLAMVLHNMEYNVEAASSADFTDVPADTWYAEAVAWAAEKGIIYGYPDGGFGPSDAITREQVAVMLYRYVGCPEVSAGELNFTDADDVSSFAEQAIAWAVSNHIMNGTGDGRLDPQGTASRAQVAQMLLNFVSSMA